MNAGRDYTAAKAWAQANADRFRVEYVLHGYNGAWWIDRLSTYSSVVSAEEGRIHRIPEGAEIIRPRPIMGEA